MNGTKDEGRKEEMGENKPKQYTLCDSRFSYSLHTLFRSLSQREVSIFANIAVMDCTFHHPRDQIQKRGSSRAAWL